MDLARNNGAGAPTFGMPLGELSTMVTAGMEQRVGRYYLRVSGRAALERMMTGLKAASIDVQQTSKLVQKAQTTHRDLEHSCPSVAVITGVAQEATLRAAVLEPMGDTVAMIRVEGPW